MTGESTTPSRSPRRRFIARDDLMRTERAAEFTGLTARQIRYYAETGVLPYEVVPGARRPIKLFRRSDLVRLLEPGRAPAPP
jgi:hypothetical protein